MMSRIICLVTVLVLLGGCAAHSVDKQALVREADPHSILVLPPMNESLEVNAPYLFLPSVPRPLAEQGYYVFPITVVDQFMKDNGLPTPAEMHAVPIEQLRKIFGADAVLYVNIKDWGQQYRLIDSVTVVSSEWRLIDARNGQLLWTGTSTLRESSSDGSRSIEGMLISALLTQIIDTLDDKTPYLARRASARTVLDRQDGLPPGPYLRKVLKQQ